MSLHLEIDEHGRAAVTFDSAPLHIYDLVMRDALIEAVEAVRDVPDVRVLVIRATGPNSGAGADVREFGSAESIAEARRIRWDRDPWLTLSSLEVPTVISLHGVCFGSALELALYCDLRYASPGTRLCLPETKLGMIPAAGATQTATAWVGSDAAFPLVAFGREIDLEHARRIGLVHDVVEDPDQRASDIAAELCAIPRSTWRSWRAISRASVDLPLASGLEVERRHARLQGLRR